LDFEKNVGLKNVKKYTYSFTGHLITPSFTQLPKVIPVSHQHRTSCSEMRTQKTMPLRTVCDNAYIPITTMNFEAKICIDIFSANLIRLCNDVSVIIQPHF